MGLSQYPPSRSKTNGYTAGGPFGLVALLAHSIQAMVHLFSNIASAVDAIGHIVGQLAEIGPGMAHGF